MSGCTSAGQSKIMAKYFQVLVLAVYTYFVHSRNVSFEACSTDFFTLEQSLLLSSDNRFNILKAFYPPREAYPVMVRVNYTFNDDLLKPKIWMWSQSEFYLIQPLEVFLFSSLLFSNFPYRLRELSVQLHAECSNVDDRYLELLTGRMKLYAQSPTTGITSSTLAISDEYVAVAASMTEILEDSFQTDFVKVWLHLTLVIFPIGTFLMVYICDPVQLLLGDKTWTKLEDEHTHGTVAALIQLSIIFVVFVFILDIVGIYYTVTTEFLAYTSNSTFYLSTVTGMIVDVAAFCWVLFVLISSTHRDCKMFWSRGRSCGDSERIKKLLSTITIASLLSLSNHAYFIILAFISDPFHAGSIAILYGISFFLLFFIFRQFYNRMVLHSNKRPKKIPRVQICDKCLAKEKRLLHPPLKADNSDITMNNSADDDNTKCDCFIPGPDCHAPFNTQVLLLSLVLIGPLVLLYEGVIVILLLTLPITKSIEDAPSTLYSIYQGTGILIVSLLTYNIVLRPNPFSISKTVERLAKRLQLPDRTNYWNRLTDEEKCAKVITTLIMEGYLREPSSRSVDEERVLIESEL